MDLRFDGTVGNFAKDENLVVKQTFKMAQDQGPHMKELNDLDMNVKLFVALTCNDQMFQLGYVQMDSYKRDNKGGYVLTLRSNSKSFIAPPDELYAQQVGILLVEPADLEKMLEEMGFGELGFEDTLEDTTETVEV